MTTPATASQRILHCLRTSCPMTSATAMADQAGNTALGVPTKARAITTPNTAFTMSNNRNTMTMNNARVRLPTMLSESAPMDCPLWRLLAQSAPKSWTPAKNIVPNMTQRTAGTQPQ